MSSAASIPVVPARAVPERYRWAITVLLVAAVLIGVASVVGLLGQVRQLVA